MMDHQLASLIQRLRGEYRIPITDGLGAVGGGEEPDNPNEFVRRFETPPIQKEAAAALEALAAEVLQLRAHVQALLNQLEGRPIKHPGQMHERNAARAALTGGHSNG